MYSDFNKRFDRATRFHRRFFRAILAFQLAIALAMVCLIVIAAQAVNKADWSNGVKPVIEKAWCGKPGCMSDS